MAHDQAFRAFIELAGMGRRKTVMLPPLTSVLAEHMVEQIAALVSDMDGEARAALAALLQRLSELVCGAHGIEELTVSASIRQEEAFVVEASMTTGPPGREGPRLA
ncbi:MAG: acetate--CoA ligase family protein [Pseudomonadota bacterium]